MSKQQASPRRLLVFAASMAIVTGYDMSSILIAAASIRSHLDFSAQTSAWIISGFTLTFGGFLLLGGRLGDIYGRRRIIIVGTALFIFAALLGACATNSGWFLVSRALKGMGAALMVPNTLALINTTFAEGKERHKAFGVFGFFGEIGYAGGNFLGGILTGYSWRATVATSAAIGVVILIEAAQLHLLRDKDAVQTQRFDLVGAVLSVAAFGSLLFGITDAVERGFSSGRTIMEGGVSAGCFALFFWRISHFPFPLLPPELLQKRNVVGASVVMFLFMACDQGTVFQVVGFLQEVLKYSPERSGIAFAPLILFTLTSAFCANRLLDSLGFKNTIALGLTVRTLALLALVTFGAGTSYLGGFLPIMIFISLSFPMTLISLHIPAGLGIAKEMQGIAYGTIYALEQIGMTFGLNILSAVALTARHAHGGASSAAMVYGFRMSTLTSACVSALTLILALIVLKAPKPQSSPEPLITRPVAAR